MVLIDSLDIYAVPNLMRFEIFLSFILHRHVCLCVLGWGAEDGECGRWYPVRGGDSYF